MILPIVKYGDPVLRAKGRVITEITPELKQLAADMIETMHHANGVGLAAQQIGQDIQLTVIEVTDDEDRPSEMFINGEQVALEDHMPLILFNPELKLGKERDSGTEGCLSFPELTAEISRSWEVHCDAMLLDGSKISFDSTGLLARALQHETDHLHGVLFIDRMNAATKATLAGRLKRMAAKI